MEHRTGLPGSIDSPPARFLLQSADTAGLGLQVAPHADDRTTWIDVIGSGMASIGAPVLARRPEAPANPTEHGRDRDRN